MGEGGRKEGKGEGIKARRVAHPLADKAEKNNDS